MIWEAQAQLNETPLITVCEISIRLPDSYILKGKQDRMVIIAGNTTGKKGNEHLILLGCKRNTSRTSSVAELKNLQTSRGASVVGLRNVLIAGRIPGVLYRKERKLSGGPVSSGELYFATRDYEYRIKVASRFRAGENELHRKQLLRIAEDIIKYITISDVARPALSEEEYIFRRNLLALLVLGLAGIAAIIVLFVRKKRSRPDRFSHSQNEKEPGRGNGKESEA